MIAGVALFTYIHSSYFKFIEQRHGAILNDPLLIWLPSVDLSWYIFPIFYCCVLFTLVNLSYYPRVFLLGIQTYILVTIARMICIYLVPLEPPSGIVLLKDPVLDWLVYDHNITTKDLLFSGHVSTQFILCLSAQNKTLKYLNLVVTLLLAVLLLIQHIHYTIDVVAAPVFAWACYTIVNKLSKTYINIVL